MSGAGPSGVAHSAASESGDSYVAPSSADKLVGAVSKLLGKSSISSREHLRAAVLLERLQAQLHLIRAEAAVKLSFLLMRMLRNSSSTEMDAEEKGFYRDSMVLLFVVIAAIHAREAGEVDEYDAHALASREVHLRELESRSMWSQLCRPSSRKRARGDESVNGGNGGNGGNGDNGDNADDDAGFSDVHSMSSMPSTAAGAAGAKKAAAGNYNFSASKDVEDLNSAMEREREDAEKLVLRPMLVDNSSSRWHDVLYDGRDVAGTVVAIAAARLQSMSTLEDMQAFAVKYARTMLEQSRSTLLTASRSNFMSLKVSSLMMLGNVGVVDAVGSLVASSASESAQVTYRDLLLSFLLPRDFVGVRRTLLLPRHVSTQATKDFSTYVSLAHESAIAGLVGAHESDSELKRMCALLTSIAMLTTGSDIRQDDAFGGRVLLPFIETAEPEKKGCLQLFVDVAQRQFTLFRYNTGKPEIELSGAGIETLETALVLIADDR